MSMHALFFESGRMLDIHRTGHPVHLVVKSSSSKCYLVVIEVRQKYLYTYFLLQVCPNTYIYQRTFSDFMGFFSQSLHQFPNHLSQLRSQSLFLPWTTYLSFINGQSSVPLTALHPEQFSLNVALHSNP